MATRRCKEGAVKIATYSFMFVIVAASFVITKAKILVEQCSYDVQCSKVSCSHYVIYVQTVSQRCFYPNKANPVDVIFYVLVC